MEHGRIALHLRTALRGELPAAFELKRSPLAPPPLARGDVALVMVRGARSPYVLAGAAGEAVAVGDLPPDVVGALRRVVNAEPTPAALAGAYLESALAATRAPHPARELAWEIAEGGLRGLCELAPLAVREALPPGPAPPELLEMVQGCGPSPAERVVPEGERA